MLNLASISPKFPIYFTSTSTATLIRHSTLTKGRQQNYLRILYQFDQEAEENERSRWHQQLPKRPASEWRWLLFDTVGSKLNLSPDPVLKVALRRAKLIDEGTGSTFNALESRKLIECRVNFAKHEPFLANVQLTKLGRAVAHVGLGETAPKKQPKGQLREKQFLSHSLWQIRPTQ